MKAAQDIRQQVLVMATVMTATLFTMAASPSRVHAVGIPVETVEIEPADAEAPTLLRRACRRCNNVWDGSSWTHFYYPSPCDPEEVGDCAKCDASGYDDCVEFEDRLPGQCAFGCPEAFARASNLVPLLREAERSGNEHRMSELIRAYGDVAYIDFARSTIVIHGCERINRVEELRIDSGRLARVHAASSAELYRYE